MAYTTIDDSSAYFQTVLYTGNGGTLSITNDGNSDLQPDLAWIKRRSEVGAHTLIDSNRGADKWLESDGTAVEQTFANSNFAFASDGFNVDYNGSYNNVNKDTITYVAWQWKANGGTTASNDASSTGVGSIDSVYQANTTAGFSIVTYTGTGTAGTIAHGLGSAPNWVLVKSRGNADPWHNLVDDIGANETLEFNAYSMGTGVWNTTRPTSTVFSIGTNDGVNRSSGTFVAYCFAEKQGYSKFGGYTGNGNADGAFVYLGFRPALIIIKCTSDNATDWVMYSNKIDVNPVGSASGTLYPNLTSVASSAGGIDFLSNGFKARSTNGYNNGSARTYIYMAFAESPFVSSSGVPATAR